MDSERAGLDIRNLLDIRDKFSDLLLVLGYRSDSMETLRRGSSSKSKLYLVSGVGA